MHGSKEAHQGHKLEALQLPRFESHRLFFLVEKDVNRTLYNKTQSHITQITRVFNDMPCAKVFSACSAFRK